MISDAVKSFRLYRPPRPPTPARFATDYTVDELGNLRNSFRLVASRYRFHMRLFIAGGIGMFACIASLFLISWVVPRFHLHFLWPTALLPGILWIAALLCWLIAFCAGITAPRLCCLGCDGNINDIQRFCPECGHEMLQGSFCASCNKTLRRRKGHPQNYKIRACTHCGVMLDKIGLR